LVTGVGKLEFRAYSACPDDFFARLKSSINSLFINYLHKYNNFWSGKGGADYFYLPIKTQNKPD